MKRMLMRPTAALFPAVLLLGALFGDPGATAKLFVCWLALQLFSLCSVDAFRNAAAREPGVRRVDRRFSGAWIMILLGIAVTCAVDYFARGSADFLKEELWVIIAAGCIVIEQLFEERMFALSRNADGVVLDVLANVLLLAGMMLDASGGVAAPVQIARFYTLCGAGLGAILSIAANYAMEPMRAFSLMPRNIAFFPRAAVQSLLYPAVMIGIMKGVDLLFEDAIPLRNMDFPAVFAGMMLWRISRTVCRRAGDESRKLNLLVVVVCAALIIGRIFEAELRIYGFCALMAMLCAMIVYCAPSVRLYAAFVLLSGAWLFGHASMWMIIAACAVAVILNLHKAFLRKV